MDKNDYIKAWSEKTSLPIEEIEKELASLVEEEKQIHKELPFEQQELRALQRLALLYRKILRSPAVGFEGFILGISDCVDILAKRRREAKELYKTDPQLAVTQGTTNEEGIPLETKETWPDGRAYQQYGKPLPEHNYLRNVFGIAKKVNSEESASFFTMVLNGEKAQNDLIPVFNSIRFSAIDKGTENNVKKLNPSTFTNFLVDDSLNIPIEETLKQYQTVIGISELESYHNINKEDFNRLAVVEGDVSLMNLEPTLFGSRIMILEDSNANLEDLNAKSLTCWIPERVKLNFGEGSKVLVVGRTAQGKKKDEQGNVTDELGDVTLNAFGVFAIPKYKIELPTGIQPITELEI